MTQDAYFSLLTHTEQLLLVKFGDKLASIEVSFWTNGRNWNWNGNQNHRRTDGQTDMEVETVI